MSDSITPSNTTRTTFSISTNDLEINGMLLPVNLLARVKE